MLIGALITFLVVVLILYLINLLRHPKKAPADAGAFHDLSEAYFSVLNQSSTSF